MEREMVGSYIWVQRILVETTQGSKMEKVRGGSAGSGQPSPQKGPAQRGVRPDRGGQPGQDLNGDEAAPAPPSMFLWLHVGSWTVHLRVSHSPAMSVLAA